MCGKYVNFVLMIYYYNEKKGERSKEQFFFKYCTTHYIIKKDV